MITTLALALTLVSLGVLAVFLVRVYALERIATLESAETGNTHRLATHLESLIDLAVMTNPSRITDSKEIVFLVDSPCSVGMLYQSKHFTQALEKARLDPSYWTNGLELFQACQDIREHPERVPRFLFLPATVQFTVPYALVLMHGPDMPERLAMLSLIGFRSAMHNTLLLMSNAGNLAWAADGKDYVRAALEDTGTPDVMMQTLANRWSNQSEVEMVSVGTQGLLTGVGVHQWTLMSLSYAPALYEAVWFAVTQIALLALGILFLCLYLGLRVAGWVSRPVQDLMVAAEKAGKGQFDFGLSETGSIRELNEAKHAFNVMGSRMLAMLSETKQKAEYEKELKLAQQVQKMLTPPVHNVFDGNLVSGSMRPAAFLGGDWWGVREIPRAGKRPAMILCAGDATDHGVPPALVAATVKGAHFLLSEGLGGAEGIDPAEILQMLNRVVFDSAKGSIGMTMLVAIFDPETQTLRMANAAHPRPYLVTGGKSQSIGGRGEPLGYQGGKVQVELTEHAWKPGDRLVVYSDGLIENFQGEKNLFRGKDVVKVIQASLNLRARELYTRLLGAYDKATRGIPMADDVTLIVCEATEAAAQKPVPPSEPIVAENPENPPAAPIGDAPAAAPRETNHG